MIHGQNCILGNAGNLKQKSTEDKLIYRNRLARDCVTKLTERYEVYFFRLVSTSNIAQGYSGNTCCYFSGGSALRLSVHPLHNLTFPIPQMTAALVPPSPAQTSQYVFIISSRERYCYLSGDKRRKRGEGEKERCF